MRIVPFKAEHVDEIKFQGAQVQLSVEEVEFLESEVAYTALVDGKAVASAGLIYQWEGRELAWAFVSELGASNFRTLHRYIKKGLDDRPIKRIEMTVDCDFPQAHRWAKMLGFKLEAERMVAYSPDGRDMALYARVL